MTAGHDKRRPASGTISINKPFDARAMATIQAIKTETRPCQRMRSSDAEQIFNKLNSKDASRE